MIDKDSLPLDKPRRTPDHPTKSHVVKTRVDGKEKIIRFGEQGAKTAGKPKEGESEAMKQKRASFKARHAKNIAKGKSSPAYWADKVKWATGGSVDLEDLDEKYEGIKKPDFTLLESFRQLISDLQARAEESGTQEFDPLRALGRSGAAGSLEDLYASYADRPKESHARRAEAGAVDPDRASTARMVFDSFKAAGFSDAQAKALTAEINREGSLNPAYLFGTHTDAANKATNVGMLSWQGDRANRLMSFMADRGLIDPSGRITPGQDALNAQAEYLRWEMENDPSYTRTRETFLANPEIDPETAHEILGKNFIRWRIDDPAYRGSGFDRIYEGYDLLNMAQGYAEGGLAELAHKYDKGGKKKDENRLTALQNARAAAQKQKGLSYTDLLLDNIIGLDNDYLSAGERLGQAFNEDEIEFLKNMGISAYEGVKGAVTSPIETIQGVGDSIYNSGESLLRGLEGKTQELFGVGYDDATPDQVAQAREALVGDVLNVSQLIPGATVARRGAGAVGDTMRAVGRDVVDRLNQPGPMPTTYSNPIPGLRLYHSSPHDFDRFSMSQIGTGEGAQAYGHGLYFAESPSVSGRGGDYWRQFFNRMRSGPERTATGAMYVNKFDPEKAAAQLESNVRYHADRAVPGRYGDGPEVEEGNRLLAEENQQALDMIKSGKIVGPRTYEVEVNANPKDFIDFDAPWESQPEAVKRHFAYLAKGERKPTGEDLARRMESNIYIREAAESGVPGIRYLDEGSRNQALAPYYNVVRESDGAVVQQKIDRGSKPEVPEGFRAEGPIDTRTRNYVIFDENLINIVRKYGIAGAAAMLGVSAADVEQAMAQGNVEDLDQKYAGGGFIQEERTDLPRIYSREPTVAESVEDWWADKIRRVSGDTPFPLDERDSQRIAKRVANLLSYVPISAGMMSGAQAERDIEAGDYGTAALNAGTALLDVVPIAAATKGGVSAIKSAADDVTELAAKYMSPDDIARFAADESGALRLYHGSPHDFDRFSMSKIGTGEGAQAYGHGLYFAENEGIARGYRDALTDPDAVPLQFDGRPVNTPWNEEIRERWPDYFNGLNEDDADAMEELLGNLSQVNNMADVPNVLGGVSSRAKTLYSRIVKPKLTKPDVGAGRMYEVNVNANPENFLDWDRPLSEQSQSVRDALGRLGIASAESGNEAYMRSSLQRFAVMKPDGTFGPGPDTYDEALALVGGDPSKVRRISEGSAPMRSEALRREGIPGIRYLDAGSRGAGDGTRNYVIFDENLINIVRKYGIAGAAAMLGVSAFDVEQAMAQSGSSQYDPDAIEATAARVRENKFAAGGAVKYDPGAVDRIITKLREVNRG